MEKWKLIGLVCVGLGLAAPASAQGTAARPANLPENYVPSESEQIELAAGPIGERLREQYAGRLAGIYFDRDASRIVVRLTGAEAVEPEEHQLGSASLHVVFYPGASHTFAELNEILNGAAGQIETALPAAHARYVDERTGEVVVMVDTDAPVTAAEHDDLARLLGVPVRIEAAGRVVAQPAASSRERD